MAPFPTEPQKMVAPAEPAPLRDPPSFRAVDEALFEALRRAGHRKIVLQVPAGLVRNAHDLASRIREAAGAKVVLVARPCFGACDPPTEDEAARAEAAVVLGHAPIPNVRLDLPTYFVEMRDERAEPRLLGEAVSRAGVPRRLGLVASVQHLDVLGPLAEVLRELGYHVEVGRGDQRLAYAGQALGCNYTGAEETAGRVDAFLFVGTGQFHPVGLALAVDRPVYALDPVRATVDPPVDRANLVRARQLLVARCFDARRFGVLASTFVGQDRSSMAQALTRKIREHGKEAEVLVFGRLDPQDLVGRDVDAYVNTACPRIALDDANLYPRPMLTPPELLMALREIPLEPYRFDTYH